MFRKQLLSCFLCLSFFVTGCGQVENGEVLKIGVSLPLTGALAEYGNASKNALEMAQAESRFLSENVEFVFEDSQYDPKKAVTLFNKFVTIDQVDLVMDFGSPTGAAVAAIAKTQNVPFLPMSSAKKLSEGQKHIVRLSLDGDDLALPQMHYLREIGCEKIGILKTENTYLNTVYDGLLFHKQEEEVELVNNFQYADLDFRTIITRLKQEDYACVGLLMTDEQVINFARQAIELDYRNVFFGTDFIDSQRVVEKGAGSLEDMTFVATGVSSEFREKYMKQFGNDHQIAFGGIFYDFIHAFAKHYKNDPDIVASIHRIEDYEGVTGVISVKEKDGDFYVAYVPRLKRVEGGKIVEVE